MKSFGPMRTALFVPGSRPDLVDEAVESGADAIIVDLEDAVALSEKTEARPKVRKKILEYGNRQMIVRVNGLDSGLIKADLEEVVILGLECIMVPKVEGKDHVREIDRLLLAVEKEKGMEPGAIAIIPLIESAMAVENAFEIVSEKTSPARLFTAAFGAADYTLDMGIEITRDGAELLYPRSRVTVACRAAGVEPPLDTPFMIDLNDLEALRTDARRAKQLGFQGKLCVHSNQIEPCHEIFSPTDEEILYAERVIRAFDAAEAKGTAAIEVDGNFIDYPVVKKARRVLNLAKTTVD